VHIETYSDPKVVRLGEEHGAVGLAWWIGLLCNAGAQDEGGTVELSFRNFAFELFSDSETVGNVLDTAADVGLCRVVSRDVHGFKVSIPAWKRRQGAGRKAKEREVKKGLDQANVAGCRVVSSDVPRERPKREVQEREKESPKSPRAEDSLTQEICGLLQRGLDSLGDNDNGRPWPSPRSEAVETIIAGYDPEVVRVAARETREIVQSQDRAPNVTALFKQKLSEHPTVSEEIREALS